MRNNRSYEENAYYNISMINLTEKKKEFKTKIIKIIINLKKNHIKYYMKEFCNCEEFDRTIKLLTNIKAFLESLG